MNSQSGAAKPKLEAADLGVLLRHPWETEMTFADTWNSIQNNLGPGAQVKNWTAAKGYLGDIFTIVRVSPGYVVVSSPEAENEQSVPKQDFQKLHGVWSGYCAGSVQRQDIRDMTRFSKYIISILHHINPKEVSL